MERTNTIKKIENNLWELYRLVAGHLKLPIYESQGLSFINAAPSPWPYFVYIDHKTKNISDLTAHISENIIQKKIPPFIISSPLQTMQPYIHTLQDQSIKLVMKWPAMYKKMDLKPSIIETKVSLVEVNTQNEITQWFGLAEENLFPGKRFEDIFLNLKSIDSLKFYLCYFENKLAGGLLVHIHENIAGIYMVSIYQKLRGMGIGKDMMRLLMEQLRKMDVGTLVLEANNNSEAFYKNLGFESVGNFEIYWKIGLF